MTQSTRRACACPGCRLPISLTAEEVAAPDEPASREVMCAFCGTVTARTWLARRPRPRP